MQCHCDILNTSQPSSWPNSANVCACRALNVSGVVSSLDTGVAQHHSSGLLSVSEWSELSYAAVAIEVTGLPSEDMAQKLGASWVCLVPSGRIRTRSMRTVCPGDTASAGTSTLAADLGSLGIFLGAAGASTTSSSMTGS